MRPSRRPRAKRNHDSGYNAENGSFHISSRFVPEIPPGLRYQLKVYTQPGSSCSQGARRIREDTNGAPPQPTGM